MQDTEIQNGGKLTVRDSQMAIFVNEGKIADVFGPGLYTLNTQTLPILTYLMNWDKEFKSPFKSDVYFFSTRCRRTSIGARPTPSRFATRNSARCGCAASEFTPITSAIRKIVLTKVSGTRDIYRVADLEGQLRNTIIGRMTDTLRQQQVPFPRYGGEPGRACGRRSPSNSSRVCGFRTDAGQFRR